MRNTSGIDRSFLPRKRRGPRRKVVLFVVLGAVAFCLGLGIATLAWLSRDLPSTMRLQVITQSLVTQVLDKNSEVYGSFGIENRVAIPLEEMPPHLIQAVLSVEDRRFYKHPGVDVIRWPKVFLTDVMIRLKSRSAPLQGASTLTQQLARDLFLTKDQSLERKLKELILSLKIERAYSKDEILTMYLNQIYFGAGAWGVEAISQTLFGKPAAELKVEEAALIAGLPKNPWANNPLRFPERAVERRNLALSLMADNGQLSRAACDSLSALPLALKDRRRDAVQSGAYLLEYIRIYLEENYGTERLYRDGLRVYTSIDPAIQRIAEEEMEEYLLFLEERMGYWNTYARMRAKLEAGQPVTAADQYLQGAVLVLDQGSDGILAMVGGRDFRHSEYNRAVQAPRQPGSAFKPFIYMAAIENGLAPSDKIMDTPVVIQIPGQSKPYKPRNHSGEFLGEITLREALAKSINVPAVKLVQRLGPVTVIDYARRLGIESPLPNVISIALGSVEVNLLELTNAYASIAAGGIQSRPFVIQKVVDRWGQVLEEHKPERREAVNPRSDYILTNMMESVLSEGTGVRARSLGFTQPAAGKTGTTDSNYDAWFVGFTRYYTCGVWVGFDEKQPMGQWMEGSHAALPIWTEIMKRVHADLKPLPFEVPDGVVVIPVCRESGLRSTRYCPETVQEVFIAGKEPTRSCDRHSPSESSFLGGGGGEFRELDKRNRDEGAPRR